MWEPLAKVHSALYASDTGDHYCPACIEGRVDKIEETEDNYILECDEYAHIYTIEVLVPVTMP